MLNNKYTADYQWLVSLPPSAQAYLKLWEESNIQTDFDTMIKMCNVSGATMKEGFLDTQPVKDRLDASFEDLVQENGGRPEATGDRSGAIQLQDVDEMNQDDADNATVPAAPKIVASPRKSLGGAEGKSPSGQITIGRKSTAL